MTRGPKRRPLAERLRDRSETVGECIVWTGARLPKGYGVISYHVNDVKKLTLVHRAVWMEAHGPIPDGLQVMHSCDNPPCHRLKHLELGTNQQNVDDMVSKGRHGHANHQLRTHCRKGHLYDEANTGYETKKGRKSRLCRACNREWQRRAYAAKKATATAPGS